LIANSRVFAVAVRAVLASYSSIIHNQFLDYDDNEYITNNAHVKAG